MSENRNSTTPNNINTSPPQPLPNTGASRLIIDAIQPTIKEIRDEIKDAEKRADSHFKWLLAAFGGGFVILAGMIIASYQALDAKFDTQNTRINEAINSNYIDLDDKFESSQQTLVAVTTQLADLLQRIPPAISRVPDK